MKQRKVSNRLVGELYGVKFTEKNSVHITRLVYTRNSHFLCNDLTVIALYVYCNSLPVTIFRTELELNPVLGHEQKPI